MKSVFLVSLHGTGVWGQHQVMGFLSRNDKDLITNIVKNQHGIILRDLLPNRFTFQNGCHWEYSTNRLDVDVHVDICENLDEHEDE